MAVVLPAAETDRMTRTLVDHFQRGFPLVSRPFAEIAAQLASDEATVIARLAALAASGAVSRVGAVVRPHTAGASTLAALAAPPAEIEAVAAKVSAFAGVNHNYERENTYNLWFVVTGRTQADVDTTLAGIEAATGLAVLNLPLEKSYHIDLGFALFGERPKMVDFARPAGAASPEDRQLLAAIEHGLPLVARPYAAVAAALGSTEQAVIARLDRMITAGIISRFGVVVRHRAFGYTANAMAVWDIADAEVDAIAEVFAREAGVTLCYRRPRRLPGWRFNLFTMIHGKERAGAEATIAHLAALAGSALAARDTLFSTRCFKQRGAVFSRQEQGDAA